MGLIDRIKKIAHIHGIPEEKLILEEAEWFLEEHGHHGDHQLRLEYGMEGMLSRIELYCTGDNLVRTRVCTHQREDNEDESAPSVIYFIGQPTIDVKYQKNRRL